MKKTLLLVLLLACTTFAYSQISVTPIGKSEKELDRVASFSDNLFDLYEYIENHYNRPKQLEAQIVPEYVKLRFTLSKEGKISKVKSKKIKHYNTDPLLQKEFVRIISNMPKWNPTIYKGKAIELSYEVECQLPFTNMKKIDRSTITEKDPSFPGGTTALFTFVSSTMQYPKEAQEEGIEGRVVVKFLIKDDGAIDDITITQSVHPLLDAEAIRIVEAMPKWEPAEADGQKMNKYFTLPIRFRFR